MRWICALATVVIFGGYMLPVEADSGTSPVVLVVCDDRQGSGALISLADGGYVVTAGHVVLDGFNGARPNECFVGFADRDSGDVVAYYEAIVEHAEYDARDDRDFAVLRVGLKTSGSGEKPAGELLVNTFAQVGDGILVRGFPASAGGRLESATGEVTSFKRGTVRMTAEIEEGYSGGPVLDGDGRMVGIITRVSTEIDENGDQTAINYEAGDVLALLAWLDELPGGHDKYVTHADEGAYLSEPYQIRNEKIGCEFIVRTPERPTLYCLQPGNIRFVFPNESTYFTWFTDFEGAHTATVDTVSQYRLIGNLTMRPGSLIKITTDPRVYLVTDGIGTIREVPDERTATEYFGSGWAKTVRDVPDSFFTDYRVGQPLLSVQ